MKRLGTVFFILLFAFFLSGCVGKFYDIAQGGSVEDLKREIATKEDKQEALGWAAAFGNLAQVEYLLQEGVDVNYYVPDDFGLYPAIKQAAGTGNLKIVQLLVEHGADINRRGMYGWSAVAVAAWHGHAEILRYLAEKGADFYATDEWGRNALTLLKDRGDNALAQELLQIQQKEKLQKQARQEQEQKLAEIEKQKQQILLYIQEQNFEALKVYVEEHPNAANFIPQPELRLALTGPKDLKVGDIRKLVQKGMDEKIILSLIKRVKVPYKEFTLEEIDMIIDMGISSTVIATMIDVTTELLKDQERKKEQELFLKEQAKIAKDGQKTHIIHQQTQTQGQEKDVVDVITEEAAKQGVKMLLDHLF